MKIFFAIFFKLLFLYSSQKPVSRNLEPQGISSISFKDKSDSLLKPTSDFIAKDTFITFCGVYRTVTENKGDCEITLTNKKVHKVYVYYLQVGTSSFSGKSFFIVHKGQNTILKLRGKNLEIAGQISSETVVFQNYGNAINEFELFPECDQKYIELFKQ